MSLDSTEVVAVGATGVVTEVVTAEGEVAISHTVLVEEDAAADSELQPTKVHPCEKKRPYSVYMPYHVPAIAHDCTLLND